MEYDPKVLTAHAITTVAIVLIAIAFWLVISKSLNVLKKHPRVSSQLVLPIRLALRYLLIIVTIILLLNTYGIPIGNFWTFISTLLGLVAIGFVAVWSVLSNISSTFLILLFQPIRVGDYVQIVGEEVKGTVQDINFMFTTLRTHEGDVYRVPNNQFFQKSILKPAHSDQDKKVADVDDSEKAKDSAIDHSQQNLEGTPLDGGSKK